MEFPTERPYPKWGPHFSTKIHAREALRRHFDRLRRRVFIACELPVFYPGQPMFAPDLMAVMDVDLHDRDHWTVSLEGKGPDFVLEILYLSNTNEDIPDNMRWYAELGIPEYFVFDRKRLRIRGYRLPTQGKIYEPIVPQAGAYSSGVLGLELGLDHGRLRFFQGSAPLPEYEELIERLDGLLDQLLARNDEEERRAQEAERRWAAEADRAEEAERRLEEETARADDAEQRLAAAEEELGQLRQAREGERMTS
jgi:Uma2 family endonuclease